MNSKIFFNVFFLSMNIKQNSRVNHQSKNERVNYFEFFLRFSISLHFENEKYLCLNEPIELKYLQYSVLTEELNSLVCDLLINV